MASIDNKELEKKLVEAGNKLLQLPSSVDEILFLLDQVENYLSRVEQSPSQSMQIALSPSMKALVADELLRHRDADVKVAVASCISEITRITAPDAPYDDDQMKDIFQLIVSSFENLSDMASRSYDKRTLILETVAKVRSCVVMLDLECGGLIIEMFHHFLKAIRDDHPDNVFSSMETIMTLVLEESEDISLELISPILATMKSDNQEVPSIARKLAERVVENSATKLKPCLIQATKTLGFSVNDYSTAISSIFSGTTSAVGRNDGSACVEQSTEEINLARASSDVPVQDENKLAVASPDETAQVQTTKDSLPETRAEGDHPADDRSLMSVVSNGVTEAGYVDRTADHESSKEQKLEQEQLQEQARQTDKPVDANVTINGEPSDSNSRKTIKSDSKTEEASKKRRRKKSVNNSTKCHDSSRVDSDKEAETTAHYGKSLSKEVHSLPSGELSAEVPVPREIENKDVHMFSPKELGSKEMDAASPSSSGNLPAEGRSKKTGRAKKNDDLTRGVATSDDVSKKASGGTGGSEGKQQRRSGKKATAGRTNQEKTLSLEDKSKKRSQRKATAGRNTDVKTPALADKSKSEDGSTSDSENKPLKLCVRKVDATENIGDGSSSKKKEDGKRRIRRKSISKSNSIQSTKDDDKEMVSSPKPALNLAKVEDHLEDTPKKSSKRKRLPVKEKIDALEYGDNLIGSKVKVWWPEDHEFYQGAIVSFDAFKKKHKVVYTDGDEEILNLEQEKWEIVGADSVSDVEQATECRSPDPPNEISPATRQKKKRAKTNSEPSAKQGKMEGSRGEASSRKSKGAATKSGPKSRVDGKCTDDISKSGDKTDASGGKSEDCSKKNHKSIDDISTTDEKSKDALAQKAGSKMKLGTQKTNMEDTPKMDTPKTASKSKGKATKSSNKPNANGSGKVKEETLVKEEESPEMVKTPESTEWMSSKGQKTGTKVGKKRRRGGAKH